MKTGTVGNSKSDWDARSALALAAVGLILFCAPLASAEYEYDEAVDGDLPHPSSAFVIPFGPPNPNTITFTIDTGSDGWIVDIGPGETLESFTLTDFNPLGNDDYTATFHMYDGPTQGDPVLGTEWASFGSELLGVDFLEHFDIGPLGEGQYLFNYWHDNSNGNWATMEFDLNIVEDSPPGIPCEDILAGHFSCNPNSALKIGIRLTDDSHDGETVIFSVDGVPHEVTVVGRGAKLFLPNQSPGSYTIELTDPADCIPAETVTCD